MNSKNILIPISMIMSFGLLFAATNSFDAFAQMNQTAQQTNQTQANQTTTTTPPPTNQTSQQTNQSSSQQQKQLNATELLALTNAAILALNEDDTEQVAQGLALIQQQLINATGQEVVLIPSDVIMTEEDIEDAEE